MTLAERLARLGGHDPVPLRAVDDATHIALGLGSLASIAACVLAGVASGYATSLVADAPWIYVPLGLAVFGLLFAIVRIAVAAGGIPLGVTDPAVLATWRPGVGPLVVLVALTWMLAYPSVLWLHAGALDADVAALRERQVATFVHLHPRGTYALDGSFVDADTYARDLATQGFVGHRIGREWDDPAGAIVRSLALLVLVGALHLARVFQLRHVRAFERARHARNRERVRLHHAHVRAHIDAVLTAWSQRRHAPPYTPTAEIFLDPPFDLQPVPYFGFVRGRILTGRDVADVVRRLAARRGSSP